MFVDLRPALNILDFALWTAKLNAHFDTSSFLGPGFCTSHTSFVLAKVTCAILRTKRTSKSTLGLPWWMTASCDF